MLLHLIELVNMQTHYTKDRLTLTLDTGAEGQDEELYFGE